VAAALIIVLAHVVAAHTIRYLVKPWHISEQVEKEKKATHVQFIEQIKLIIAKFFLNAWASRCTYLVQMSVAMMFLSVDIY
jgi:hypothetical protein